MKAVQEASGQNVEYMIQLVSTAVADRNLVQEVVKDLNGIKATNDGAIRNTIRLTEVCLDLRRGLEKDRYTSSKRCGSLAETLGQIERRPWRFSEALPLVVREIAVHIDRVKLVVGQLVRMLGISPWKPSNPSSGFSRLILRSVLYFVRSKSDCHVNRFRSYKTVSIFKMHWVALKNCCINNFVIEKFLSRC